MLDIGFELSLPEEDFDEIEEVENSGTGSCFKESGGQYFGHLRVIREPSSDLHECDGWYIYSNISNGQKAEDLKRISAYYHLGLRIEEGKPE